MESTTTNSHTKKSLTLPFHVTECKRAMREVILHSNSPFDLKCLPSRMHLSATTLNYTNQLVMDARILQNTTDMSGMMRDLAPVSAKHEHKQAQPNCRTRHLETVHRTIRGSCSLYGVQSYDKYETNDYFQAHDPMI